MPKVTKSDIAKQGGEKGCADTSLDKLAQLRKRGARKFIQQPIIEALIGYAEKQRGGVSHKWVKHFSNILSCSSTIKSDGNKATAKYCNSRACLICSAIRTGKLWNAYESSLKALKEPFFVTLTQGARVGARELKPTIEAMHKALKQSMDVMKKRGRPLVGFRKLEIAYATDGKHKGTYHPHFHILVEGEAEAYYLVSEWLKRNPNANQQAQDVRAWKDGDLNEVFKYITTFFDVKRKGEKAKPIPIGAMYNIVVAMERKRSFQTFGKFAKGTQEAEDVNEGLEPQTYNIRQGTYQWEYGTWYGTCAVGDGTTPGIFVPLIENPTTEPMREHYKYLKECLNV